jgi:hypothetical protein
VNVVVGAVLDEFLASYREALAKRLFKGQALEGAAAQRARLLEWLRQEAGHREETHVNLKHLTRTLWGSGGMVRLRMGALCGEDF